MNQIVFLVFLVLVLVGCQKDKASTEGLKHETEKQCRKVVWDFLNGQLRQNSIFREASGNDAPPKDTMVKIFSEKLEKELIKANEDFANTPAEKRQEVGQKMVNDFMDKGIAERQDLYKDCESSVFKVMEECNNTDVVKAQECIKQNQAKMSAFVNKYLEN